MRLLRADHRVDIALRGKSGQNALHAAAQFICVEAIRELLSPRFGFDVNARADDGETALFFAANNPDDDANADVVDVLLNAGADVNLANPDGATPLYGAVVSRSPAIVARLLAVPSINPSVVVFLKSPLNKAHSDRDKATKEITTKIAKWVALRTARGAPHDFDEDEDDADHDEGDEGRIRDDVIYHREEITERLDPIIAALEAAGAENIGPPSPGCAVAWAPSGGGWGVIGVLCCVCCASLCGMPAAAGVQALTVPRPNSPARGRARRARSDR
jgi:hypothetical protein